MATNKLYHRKKRYAKEHRSNYPIPTWVTVKTDRKLTRRLSERHWRRNRIKR